MNGVVRNVLTDPVGSKFSADDSLLTQYNKFFTTVLADTGALRESAHALRFQVYCLERKFENAEQHPDGLETDEYDAHAVQGVLFYRPSQSAMGAARVILTRGGMPDNLPIERLLRQSDLELSDYVNLSETIEISRFAISKEVRRRKSDQPEAAVSQADTLRETNLAFLGLLQFVLRECVKRKVLYWAAVMEPKFLRLLARMGITYLPVGPLVMHHGIRQPCYCYLPDMLENARRVHPECWEVLTDGGILHDQTMANAGKGKLAQTGSPTVPVARSN